MKKILLAVLAFIMCVSMCACAKEIEKEDLVGEWSLENDFRIIAVSFTSGGSFGYTYLEVNGTNVSDYEGGNGSYSIDGDEVKLQFNDKNPFGSTVATIEDGKLCIGNYKLTKD